MGKFVGKIGFSETVETAPGVWRGTITEKSYTGDLIRNGRRWQESGNLNDDFTMTSTVSVIADTYACNHVAVMKYVLWMGIKWKITSFDILYPRINLTLGGVYNENET